MVSGEQGRRRCRHAAFAISSGLALVERWRHGHPVLLVPVRSAEARDVKALLPHLLIVTTSAVGSPRAADLAAPVSD
jgi:hypothetical protein